MWIDDFGAFVLVKIEKSLEEIFSKIQIPEEWEIVTYSDFLAPPNSLDSAIAVDSEVEDAPSSDNTSSNCIAF
jgi:hypothetical protein